eukprot:3072959-Rhodomonas_salina.2
MPVGREWHRDTGHASCTDLRGLASCAGRGELEHVSVHVWPKEPVVKGGVGAVSTEMTGVWGVVVENVCSEGINVGHTSAMMITIKEVE